jgi:hypothetical protein
MYLSKTYHLIQDHLDHLKNVPIKNISLDPGPLRPLNNHSCKICVWPCKTFFHIHVSVTSLPFFFPNPTNKTETGIGKWGGRLCTNWNPLGPIKLSTQLETRNSQERLIWLPLLLFRTLPGALSESCAALFEGPSGVLSSSTGFDWWTSSKISGSSHTQHWLGDVTFSTDGWTSSKISGSHTEHWWRCSFRSRY